MSRWRHSPFDAAFLLLCSLFLSFIQVNCLDMYRFDQHPSFSIQSSCVIHHNQCVSTMKSSTKRKCEPSRFILWRLRAFFAFRYLRKTIRGALMGAIISNSLSKQRRAQIHFCLSKFYEPLPQQCRKINRINYGEATVARSHCICVRARLQFSTAVTVTLSRNRNLCNFVDDLVSCEHKTNGACIFAATLHSPDCQFRFTEIIIIIIINSRFVGRRAMVAGLLHVVHSQSMSTPTRAKRNANKCDKWKKRLCCVRSAHCRRTLQCAIRNYHNYLFM